MPRVLVIVPNDSYRAADFSAAADALDIELAIASEERPPLRPDDRFVRIDCTDPRRSAADIVELATRTPIDAIVAADDTGVAIAALASAALGLPTSPPRAAAATLDKIAARRALATAEVPQPDFTVLHASDDPGEIVARMGPPVVIKPASLSAGRGVLRVDDPDSAADTTQRIRGILTAAGHDPAEDLLVERYVDGDEVSVEGIVWDGEVEILAVFDKPIPMEGPAFEESIFVTPSQHPPAILADIARVATGAVQALGLTEGPIHAELRIEDGRPQVIEIAGRTIGGLCGRALRFGLLGAPLETLVLRHALGLRKQSLHREVAASGVLMIPVPRAGPLRGVRGLDRVRGLPGVTTIEITAPIGTHIAPPPDGDRYLGFVFARAAEPAAVERTLRQALDSIEVDVG